MAVCWTSCIHSRQGVNAAASAPGTSLYKENMSSLINVVVILAVVTSGVLVAPAVAYPEYIAELPTQPKHARGVGHVSAEGGGLRNKFGQVSVCCPETARTGFFDALAASRASNACA